MFLIAQQEKGQAARRGLAWMQTPPRHHCDADNKHTHKQTAEANIKREGKKGMRRKRMSADLPGFPLRQPSLVHVSNHMGVRLHRFFFQVSHKCVAQLRRDDIRHKVGIEKDALQSCQHLFRNMQLHIYIQ